jgi:septum formation inhibitor-activating ATPase MinD
MGKEPDYTITLRVMLANLETIKQKIRIATSSPSTDTISTYADNFASYAETAIVNINRAISTCRDIDLLLDEFEKNRLKTLKENRERSPVVKNSWPIHKDSRGNIC